MTSSFKLKGGPELVDLLDRLPGRLRKNVLRGAMRAGAKVIQAEARLRVPVETGLAKRAIKISSDSNGATFTGRVSLRGRHSFLGPLIEYGVAPHFISVDPNLAPGLSAKDANKAMKRGSLIIDGKFVGASVMHPGVTAHPFMRPALDTKAREAVNAIGEYIKTRLQIGALDVPLVEVDEE